MKLYFKFSVLFFALVMLTVTSCKDDVDPIEANKAKLIGSWKVATLVQTDCTNPTENVDLVFGAEGACFEIFPGVEGCIIINSTFNADGTVSSEIIISSLLINETQESEGSWEILDETRMSVCLPDASNTIVCSTGTYTITDTTLNYQGNNSDTNCNTDLTATKQ